MDDTQKELNNTEKDFIKQRQRERTVANAEWVEKGIDDKRWMSIVGSMLLLCWWNAKMTRSYKVWFLIEMR